MKPVVLALVLAACACDLDPSEVSGTMTLPVGVFAPTACWNGDTRELYGVDLDDGSTLLRLYQDPIAGWQATVTYDRRDPSTPDLRFAPPDCTTFAAELVDDPYTRCTRHDCDDDDSTQSGHIALACPGVSGRIEFQYCNNPGE